MIMMAENRIELNRREYAILRAVAAGRGTLVACSEPDLAVDGGWCDHISVHRLVELGLIEGERRVPFGQLTLAVVTRLGAALLLEEGGAMAA
ncbi:hypothetical protein [Amycolatopsis sp. EV170708-02-1]|uniref:hypothetical protein n=1 Tax=Amycolatopsis sp. EV170708-02-1 TaxID=2919322 RepID=UPI001F0CC60F|nr:hypothetical protein [Amycolatopsis sp. EV170708-02-1]UMP06736.1 hypothetical protein MJQ72_18840 [Amycolatopsis sp. EV170708-02-1]